MPVNTLYATWFQVLTQLLPHERITRLRNLAWLLTGLATSRSVWLSHIAAVLPGTAQVASRVRRLDRFLENSAFDVRAWYEPYARQLLQGPSAQPIPLLIDSSHIGRNRQWLVVALAYRHRALPLAWDWVGCARGHSPAAQQLALLAYVRTLLPAGRPVWLVGDAEFGSIAVLQTLEAWGWGYVFRQRGQVLVRPDAHGTWQPFRRLAQPAATRWFPHGHLTAQQGHPTHLVAAWAAGQPHPWLLVTNLPTVAQALRAYRHRMWIEQLFGDVKGHGVHFETTHLADPAKLSRLALAVVLLYLGCVAYGSHAQQRGEGWRVDRRHRRDLSWTQLGWRLIQQCLVNALPLHWRFNPFRYQTVG